MKSSSSTLPSTTTSGSTTERIVLSSDGLGIVSLGDHVEDVMSILVDRFGPPSSDVLYESPFELPPTWEGDVRGPNACFEATGTGYACFDYLRFVDWTDVGLYVHFSDITRNPAAQSGDESGDPWIEVEPGFQGYGYTGGEGPLLYTADGITIGTNIGDLLELGDRVTFWWNECGGERPLEFRIFDLGVPTVQQPSWTGGSMWGSVDDRDLDHFEETGTPHRDARIASLGAGQRGSC